MHMYDDLYAALVSELPLNKNTQPGLCFVPFLAAVYSKFYQTDRDDRETSC